MKSNWSKRNKNWLRTELKFGADLKNVYFVLPVIKMHLTWRTVVRLNKIQTKVNVSLLLMWVNSQSRRVTDFIIHLWIQAAQNRMISVETQRTQKKVALSSEPSSCQIDLSIRQTRVYTNHGHPVSSQPLKIMNVVVWHLKFCSISGENVVGKQWTLWL